jgi:hypothetical protein
LENAGTKARVCFGLAGCFCVLLNGQWSARTHGVDGDTLMDIASIHALNDLAFVPTGAGIGVVFGRTTDPAKTPFVTV